MPVALPVGPVPPAVVVVVGLMVVVVDEGFAVVLCPPQAKSARHALPSSLPTGAPEA